MQISNKVVCKIHDFAANESRKDLLVQRVDTVVLEIDCFNVSAVFEGLGRDGSNVVERCVEKLQVSSGFEHFSVDSGDSVVPEIKVLEIWQRSEDLHFHFNDSVVVQFQCLKQVVSYYGNNTGTSRQPREVVVPKYIWYTNTLGNYFL